MTCNISVFDIYGTEEPVVPGTHARVGFRLPEYGDTVLAFDGAVYTFKKPDFTPKGPRIILERKEVTPESIYGPTIPATPTGYTRGEFREVQGGETFLGQGGGEVKQWGESAYNQGPRYILTPIPNQPAKAPEGYYFTGEYRIVRRGDFYTTNGFIISALCDDADYEVQNVQRHILKRLPTKPTVAGWEAVEFRAVNSGDKYYSPFFYRVATACNQDYSVPPVPYWIMRPVPTPPPLTTRWLLEVESGTPPVINQLKGFRNDTTDSIWYDVFSITPKPQ